MLRSLMPAKFPYIGAKFPCIGAHIKLKIQSFRKSNLHNQSQKLLISAL